MRPLLPAKTGLRSSKSNHRARSSLLATRRRASDSGRQWLDVWLPRISHFSQFGLFALTLGSLYFTVIPLYQKAALEEQIARKEVELKAMEQSLEASYSRVRKYTVREFVNYVGPRCTGLLVRARSPLDAPQDKNKKRSLVEEGLELDVSECLLSQMEKASPIKQLRPSDQETFASNIKKLAADLGEKRLTALSNYKAVPERAVKDPSTLMQPTYYEGQAIEKMSEWIATMSGAGIPTATEEERLQQYRFRAGVNATQRSIASEYGEYARKQIATLNSLWSETKP